jgi:LacI family transcriptional regulator
MAYELVERFPDCRQRPTAIAAFNDRTAIGVIRGCYETGIRIPEDVALIGFHDIPTARYTTPALTTIGHPLIELGEMAAESLFTLIAGGEIAERDRTVPVSLVIRESCGAKERPHHPPGESTGLPTFGPMGPRYPHGPTNNMEELHA